MKDITIISEGHLIDSGILSDMLNLITDDNLDYRIEKIDIGKIVTEPSRVEIKIYGKDTESLDEILSKLTAIGAYEKGAVNATFEISNRDAHAPEGFYSSTNHRTEVYSANIWNKVKQQRMDAVIIKKDKDFKYTTCFLCIPFLKT